MVPTTSSPSTGIAAVSPSPLTPAIPTVATISNVVDTTTTAASTTTATASHVPVIQLIHTNPSGLTMDSTTNNHVLHSLPFVQALQLGILSMSSNHVKNTLQFLHEKYCYLNQMSAYERTAYIANLFETSIIGLSLVTLFPQSDWTHLSQSNMTPYTPMNDERFTPSSTTNRTDNPTTAATNAAAPTISASNLKPNTVSIPSTGPASSNHPPFSIPTSLSNSIPSTTCLPNALSP
uniref:Uncharacterized protein n=1 Tax=Lygus hesperus TaxID=30085 RepID=A0A146MFV5_LYGHE